MPIVLALVVLAIVALGIAWFLRANPSSLARGSSRLNGTLPWVMP